MSDEPKISEERLRELQQHADTKPLYGRRWLLAISPPELEELLRVYRAAQRAKPQPAPATGDAPVVINMREPPFRNLRGMHVHTCPECFDDVPCSDTCGCFFDMDRADGTPRGHQVVCERCGSKDSSPRPDAVPDDRLDDLIHHDIMWHGPDHHLSQRSRDLHAVVAGYREWRDRPAQPAPVCATDDEINAEGWMCYQGEALRTDNVEWRTAFERGWHAAEHHHGAGAIAPGYGPGKDPVKTPAQPAPAAMAKLREALAGFDKSHAPVRDPRSPVGAIIAAARELVNAAPAESAPEKGDGPEVERPPGRSPRPFQPASLSGSRDQHPTPLERGMPNPYPPRQPAEAQPVTSGELTRIGIKMYGAMGYLLGMLEDEEWDLPRNIVAQQEKVDELWQQMGTALGVRGSTHEPVAARTVEPQATGDVYCPQCDRRHIPPSCTAPPEQPMARVEARTGEPPVDAEVERETKALLLCIEETRSKTESAYSIGLKSVSCDTWFMSKLCELATEAAQARAVRAGKSQAGDP